MATTQIHNDSRVINLSTDYYECEQWVTEPAMYRCLDSKNCKGKIPTDHGYLLACLRGCKEEVHQ